MWDKPFALRQMADTLLGVSLLLVLFGTVHYMLHMPEFSLKVVRLTVKPERVDVEQIGKIVRGEIQGNFFTVDLESTRNKFEQLPWVRKVNVRRHFPWQLEVELEEHVALASWNGNELVNTYGEIFATQSERGNPKASGSSPDEGKTQGLPKFIGQPDTAAEVTRMFKACSDQLRPLNQGVAQIKLSARRAWQLRLNSGMVLELGREQAQERLSRFVAAYPNSLGYAQQKVKYVDLRYRNGFAVYLPEGVANSKS